MASVIRRGNRNYKVTWAQRVLKHLGHYPGELDGDFGPKTEAAVRTYRRLRGMRALGTVDRGLWQLLVDEPAPALKLGAVSAEHVRLIVPMAPFANISRYWPAVHAALQDAALVDWPMLSHAIATIGVETGSFAPIIEGGRRSYFDRYEGRSDLGNVRAGDGFRYRGRGFIQITGRNNYRLYGRLLGIPLEEEPDLALDPRNAARILAGYLCRNEARLRRALDTPGLEDDRRVVNGGTNGLEGFTTLFGRALKYLPLN